MIDKAKKKTERMLFTRFLSNESLKIIATGVQEMEPPDFSFMLYENGVSSEISVELTRVLNPDLKQIESAQNRIISLAQNKFKAIRSDKLEVFVEFNSRSLSFDHKSMNDLSTQLFEIVRDIAKSNDGFNFRIESRSWPEFHKYFHKIIVKNEDAFENWQSFGAFVVPRIEYDWFSDIIRVKEKNVIKYPRKFSENWLLLLANFGHKSSTFTFEQLCMDFKDSIFDRIYIYKHISDEIIIVK